MFKGLGGLGNLANLMNEAKNIGPKMKEVAERLKQQRVTGTAGGGMVTVHANGHGLVLEIAIDESLMASKDIEMVKDLLPAAINDAMGKAKQLHVDEMKSVTGDLPIPGNIGDALQQFMTGGADSAD